MPSDDKSRSILVFSSSVVSRANTNLSGSTFASGEISSRRITLKVPLSSTLLISGRLVSLTPLKKALGSLFEMISVKYTSSSVPELNYIKFFFKAVINVDDSSSGGAHCSACVVLKGTTCPALVP